ncbi:MAG: VOC family protein, partial [Myxococcota bacterium]
TEARTWYAAVIGRGVETVEPVEGIFEFRIAERAWLQLMQVEAGTAPSPTVVRLATADIESEARRLAAAGIDIGKIEVVPEVVAYAEFRDPFGNAVGLYQVLGPPPLGAGASPP